MARADESRGLRDEANVGPDPRGARELRRISELGRWKVADGEPDIRNWPVYASTGRELGVIDDLLVDTEAGEVVMLDVDLKRDDRHTLAPLRAAWIDRASKRVVLDAREVERADVAGQGHTLPALPRQGAISDDELRRFNDDYVHAYGGRGVDTDRDYRLRRGDEEIRFGLQPRADVPPTARPVAGTPDVATRDTAGHDVAGPRRLLHPDERPHGDPLRRDIPPAAAAGGAALAGGAPLHDRPTHPAAHADDSVRSGAHFAESDRINDTLAGLPMHRDARGGMDLGAPAGGAAPVDRRDFDRTRDDRDADAALLADQQAIEPRELDGRVRIDEGGTVDDRTPVGGVRYDTPDYPRHDYELSSEYDRSRVVSRHPTDRRPDVDDRARRPVDPTSGAGPLDDDTAERRVRYRTYPDAYGRPGEERR
jgi:sporulation protein YlmC with PRC-barrel domain